MDNGEARPGDAGRRPPAAEPEEEISLARIVEEYKVLVETSAAFAVSAGLDETLQLITQLVAERLDVAWCDLYHYDAEADEFRDVDLEAVDRQREVEGGLEVRLDGDAGKIGTRRHGFAEAEGQPVVGEDHSVRA